ncbi:hypothetical protein EHJ37_19810, partial [Vibrio parahaemolyticus]|nr:hypothetical protein [Vibrio parahaemolyticus]
INIETLRRLDEVLALFQKKAKTYDFTHVKKIHLLERFAPLILELRNNKSMSIKQIQEFFADGVEIDGSVQRFEFATSDFYNLFRKLDKQKNKNKK